MADDALLIRLDAAPASDSWGFVGRVMVGDTEVYRTLRSFPTPSDARAAAQETLASALGPLLASEEWRTVHDATGHTPRRTDLGTGLRANHRPPNG